MAVNRLLDFAKLPSETFKVNREDMAAKLIKQMQDNSVTEDHKLRQQLNNNRQDNPILSKLTELAKDPSTYSALASIGSVVAAAEGEDTMASALSNISSRIDQNVRSKAERESTLAAEKFKAEEKTKQEKLKLEADDVKEQKELEKAAKLQENVLRKEFTSESKEYRKAIKQKDKLDRSLARATAAGDLSAIFAYMKILDPPSVVREGEQATAKNASGVPDRIRNLYNATLRGTKLTPTQRLDFKETSNQIIIPYIDEYRGLSERYAGIAERQNLNPLNILGDDPIESIEQKQTKQSQKEDIRKNTVDRVTEQQAIQVLED